MDCKPGDSLCGCTLRQKCGFGSYGEVWLAEDAVGARVALKILCNRGRYSERELAGLKNYRDCNHPNLLKIRYVEITADHICYTMDAADDLRHGCGEYLPDTLANRLSLYGRMDGKEILAMLDGLLNGLEELHRHGLVHRDIKPDNILWVNGRPTIADAGLIAPSGQGSLVGTPGFMSPKLLSGQGQPDSSDDFYALGKVIYCALTGLPVGEYPSIPENMTISMDASLGHAFRESCKQPVRSSAEFRKLLEGKTAAPKPAKKAKPARGTDRAGLPFGVKLLLFTVLTSALCTAGLFLLMNGRTSSSEPYVMSPEEEADLDARLKETERQVAAAEERMKAEIQRGPQERDAYLKDVQARTVQVLRDNGFLPGNEKTIRHLLQYQVMTRSEIIELLWNSNRNPRLQPTAGVHPRTSKNLSNLEGKLFEMFSVAYPDFDSKKVLARQAFWLARPDRAGMLENDPVMQALALDSIIRDEVNEILKQGSFRKGEKTRLCTLFELRHGLIHPEIGRPSFRHWFAE